METTESILVVGVRFSKVGKVYHFETNGLTDLKIGDMVVVETSRGWQLGQVAQLLQHAEPPADGWKPIDRRATPRDLLLRQLWQQKESEVITKCKDRADDLRLAGIKIVEAEYSFDGSRLTILFSSETEEKYDLKSLRGDMQKMFAPSQVEMRQIGPRDVAKTLCGMGACGLETRCCCSFLTEFSSISIRMAKEQGISLTPTEITGMCGRLRCCLIYEYDQYVDARKSLPKRNKRVKTPLGEGKVVDVIPLQGKVIVEIPEVGHREFPSEDVLPVDAGGTPVAPEAEATEPAEMTPDQESPRAEPAPRKEPPQERTNRAPDATGTPPAQRQPRNEKRRFGNRPRNNEGPADAAAPSEKSTPPPGRGPRQQGGPQRPPSQKPAQPSSSQGGEAQEGKPNNPPRRRDRGAGQTGQGQSGQPGQPNTGNNYQNRNKGKRQQHGGNNTDENRA